LIGLDQLPSREQILSRMQNEPVKPSNVDMLKLKQLYSTEEELVDDVSRLMMLQDQEGLKMRVLQLWRDQKTILKTAHTDNLSHQRDMLNFKAQ